MRKVFNGNNNSERIDGTSGDDRIFGNGGDDMLIGHPGDDKIWGGDGKDKIWGGQGHDTLWGDKGNDQFRFNSLNKADSDVVKDFSLGQDLIGLDGRVYTELGGNLSETNFVFGDGAVAIDADDHVLFDTQTGKLFYDADGSGNGDAVLLAKFAGVHEVTFETFFLFGIL